MSSSTLVVTILILAILSLCFAVNVAQSAGCSEDFDTLAHQNNLTNCKRLRTLGAELGWSYHDTSLNFTRIDILFGAKLKQLAQTHPTGWLAWGVNPGTRPQMIGTKAIIGIVHENGSMIVKTYEITNETKIGCRLLPGDLYRIRVTDQKISYDDKTEFYTIFARVNLPSDLYDIARLNHVWQVGYAVDNDAPKAHPITLENVDSSETIDLTSGNGRSTSQHLKSLRVVHGILNIVGWGTLLPIGVIGARYFKVSPFRRTWWFDQHIICQSSGYLIGTAGWATGLWLGNASRYYYFYTHRLLAVFIFTLTTLQMLALRLRLNVKDPYRKYWNMYHHFVGYTSLVLIFINIFRGISILRGGDAWKWGFVGILGFLGAIILGLEVLNWGQFIREKIQTTKEDPTEKKEAGKVQPTASPINPNP